MILLKRFDSWTSLGLLLIASTMFLDPASAILIKGTRCEDVRSLKIGIHGKHEQTERRLNLVKWNSDTEIPAIAKTDNVDWYARRLRGNPKVVQGINKAIERETEALSRMGQWITSFGGKYDPIWIIMRPQPGVPAMKADGWHYVS
ncbi:hypothetical protein FRC02_005314 [Tulasnella sp. 418]|nr:hypothetical protein FRC02_005314 [Tulasnella sp. 418]